jgi:hypothetical protein
MRKMNFPFRLGTYLLVITALVHLIGHFYKRPPANDQERRLLELMTGYQMDVGGLQRTVQQILSGFSLTFSVLLLFVAALNLSVMRMAPDEHRFVLAVTLINTIGAGVLLVISAVSFPLPPTLLFGVAYASFALSLFLLRRSTGPART